jgi:hypothetical protein
MTSPPNSTQRVVSAARSGVIGAIVGAFAFFDGVFLGAPIALLAASFRPSLVYAAATTAVVFVVIGCCSWVDRRWDDWFSGNGKRIETRLESMRGSRLMRHPVAWIERGSDRWYALAAAVANPILIAALARFVGGKPVGRHRIVLGAVAYAIPYVAMWSIVGFAVGEAVRAA